MVFDATSEAIAAFTSPVCGEVGACSAMRRIVQTRRARGLLFIANPYRLTPTRSAPEMERAGNFAVLPLHANRD
jgi:hypothetical protein